MDAAGARIPTGKNRASCLCGGLRDDLYVLVHASALFFFFLFSFFPFRCDKSSRMDETNISYVRMSLPDGLSYCLIIIIIIIFSSFGFLVLLLFDARLRSHVRSGAVRKISAHLASPRLGSYDGKFHPSLGRGFCHEPALAE